MKVSVVAVGLVAPDVLGRIAVGLMRILPDTLATVIDTPFNLPVSAFYKRRNQYKSTQILDKLLSYYGRKGLVDRVLAVIDADIYSSELAYVFGEAFTPGKVALISLRRLRPEFYGADEDLSLYAMRILKESIHELGHTLGLEHCPRSFCVMYFSNSIFDTDKKQSLFCDQCFLQASIAITEIGNRLDRTTT
jgi:archaemetzincin